MKRVADGVRIVLTIGVHKQFRIVVQLWADQLKFSVESKEIMQHHVRERSVEMI